MNTQTILRQKDGEKDNNRDPEEGILSNATHRKTVVELLQAQLPEVEVFQ